MEDAIIKVDHVSMRFNLAREKVDSLKEYIIKAFKGKLQYDEFWALKDVSFEVKRGDAVGLIGLNGSGKSTIVKLLLRLYDIDQGQILLNGIDIKEYDTAKYRSMFSALFQDFIEYSFTLRENIALSHFAELQNDEKINDAIDKSELREVIQSWAKGLETPLTRGFPFFR